MAQTPSKRSHSPSAPAYAGKKRKISHAKAAKPWAHGIGAAAYGSTKVGVKMQNGGQGGGVRGGKAGQVELGSGPDGPSAGRHPRFPPSGRRTNIVPSGQTGVGDAVG